MMLAAAGRFGLMPATKPFRVFVNADDEAVSVDELRCLAVTRGGQLIDIDYDTRFNCPMQTRLQIPEGGWSEGLIITVNATDDEWMQADNGLRMPVYYFALIAPDAPVPDNALPIAYIRLDEKGGLWRWEEDFVPPCLFVSAHHRFQELLDKFTQRLASIDEKTRKAIAALPGTSSACASAVALFWPIVQQLDIAADKERDVMTPMQLLGFVQRCVSAYNCACALGKVRVDEQKQKQYEPFVKHTYTYKDVYELTRLGIGYCAEIEANLEKLTVPAAAAPAYEPQQPQPQMQGPITPLLSDNQIKQVCKSPETTIQIGYPNPAATIFFTTDGTNPTPRSAKAVRSGKTHTVKFKNGYKQGPDEPDKTINLRLMAMVNGVTSSISSYFLQMHKSTDFKDVPRI